MDLLPLLTFSPPKPSPKLDDLPSGFVTKSYIPEPKKQYTRFKNRFKQLEQQFAEFVELAETANGLDPEKVLVLEVEGGVNTFASQLQKVPGFSDVKTFFTDEEIDDGNIVGGNGKPLRKEIYLSMSSQSGLKKLLSIWKSQSTSGESSGQGALKEVLQRLHNIRLWDVTDRLKNTGLEDDWRYRIEEAGDEVVPFEIELWFRRNIGQRFHAEKKLIQLICDSGGKVHKSYQREEIGYHGLLGELPAENVRQLLTEGGKEVELMRCEHAMYFRPVGQCGFRDDQGVAGDSEEEVTPLAGQSELYSQEPVIALLDGLPMENHTCLQRRLIIEDIDDHTDLYTSSEQQSHGTAMASLITHGDMNKESPALLRPLCVIPILAPGKPNFDGHQAEVIPENILPLDLIHRAVHHLSDPKSGAFPSVRIISLSVCDRERSFDNNMSPWARMLDWLAFKYNVLFVISAGNQVDDIDVGMTHVEFLQLSDEEREGAIIEAIHEQRYTRRMFSPAESINAITVRSSHSDEFKGVLAPNVIDPFITPNIYSPVNPITSGIRNSIKPEVMMPGGRATYKLTGYMDKSPANLSVNYSHKTIGPGQKVAWAGSQGSLNRTAYSFGTSNAAALTTRCLGELYEVLTSLKARDTRNALSHAPEATILKAMLVHGAELPSEPRNKLKDMLKDSRNSRTYKKQEAQYFGFGNVNAERVKGCVSNQATLLHTGVLALDSAEDYVFPLPECLSGSVSSRRLVITLAWMTPVNYQHHEYAQAQMWVSDVKKDSNSPTSLLEHGEYYHHWQKKGTVYHEVITGDKASIYFSNEQVNLKVNCKGRADGKKSKGLRVFYALIVTLDSIDSSLDIYTQVKNSLEISVPVDA